MIINLVKKEKGTNYTISRFPDGQQQLTINGPIEPNPVGFLKAKIISRLNNFKDLELILCATASLKEIGYKHIDLRVPYFIGARSDRKFEPGGNNYLKSVICPIINAQGYDSVTVLDPHSDVLEACLDNFKKENNFSLVKHALTKIDNTNDARNKIAVVSPDAGALKKVFDVVQEFNIYNLLIGSKHRDVKSGEITHTEITNIENSTASKFVIIDDICDGGRTFIELSKVIKKYHPNAEVYLIVSHGIFSKGLLNLDHHFTKIFTTNSVKDIDAVEYSDYTVRKTFLDQLDIF